MESVILLELTDIIIQKQYALTLINTNTNWRNRRFNLEELINLFVMIKTTEQLEYEVQLVDRSIKKRHWTIRHRNN